MVRKSLVPVMCTHRSPEWSESFFFSFAANKYFFLEENRKFMVSGLFPCHCKSVVAVRRFETPAKLSDLRGLSSSARLQHFFFACCILSLNIELKTKSRLSFPSISHKVDRPLDDPMFIVTVSAAAANKQLTSYTVRLTNSAPPWLS